MKKIILLLPISIILTSLFVLGIGLPSCDFTIDSTNPNIGCIDYDGVAGWDAVCDKSSGTTTYSATLTGTICAAGTGNGGNGAGLPACDFSQGSDPDKGCIDTDGDGTWDAVCDKSSGTTTYSATLIGTICESGTETCTGQSCSTTGNRASDSTGNLCYCDTSLTLQITKGYNEDCTVSYECKENICGLGNKCLSFEAVKYTLCTFLESKYTSTQLATNVIYTKWCV